MISRQPLTQCSCRQKYLSNQSLTAVFVWVIFKFMWNGIKLKKKLFTPREKKNHTEQSEDVHSYSYIQKGKQRHSTFLFSPVLQANDKMKMEN